MHGGQVGSAHHLHLYQPLRNFKARSCVLYVVQCVVCVVCCVCWRSIPYARTTEVSELLPINTTHSLSNTQVPTSRSTKTRPWTPWALWVKRASEQDAAQHVPCMHHQASYTLYSIIRTQINSSSSSSSSFSSSSNTRKSFTRSLGVLISSTHSLVRGDSTAVSREQECQQRPKRPVKDWNNPASH